MLRKLSIAAAVSAAFATAAFAQPPMHDTWDINAPNGQPMVPGKPAPAAVAPSAISLAPMHDTWDINAPNGEPSARAATVAAAPHGDSAVHGQAAAAAEADRVIDVSAGLRYVNVTSGETVLFRVGDRSFAWTFADTVNHPSFDLSQIAPDGIVAQGVRIYCAPDQYERAG